MCGFIDDRHSDRCEMVSHCVFNFDFLMISDVEHLFICVLSSWQKALFRPFDHFLIRLFMFFGVGFYNFFINCGYETCIRCIANMFFHSVGSLFILLMASFAVQKPFNQK